MLRRGRRSNIKRKPRRGGQRPQRRLRISRMPRTAGAGQYTSLIETADFGPALGNAGNLHTFCLGQFPRSQLIAAQFQYYKAAKVVWQYEPLFNVFGEAAGATTKPYVYTQMNRGQNVLVASLANIQAVGARPVPFIKKFEMKYTPNWCTPGLVSYITTTGQTGATSVINQGVQPCYKWLNTPDTYRTNVSGPGFWNGVVPTQAKDNEVRNLNDSVQINNNNSSSFIQSMENNVMYNGHNIWFEQFGAIENVPIARVTCTVHWLFKGAKFFGVDPLVNE